MYQSIVNMYTAYLTSLCGSFVLAYHAPVYAHAPAVISPSLYHAPAVVAHAPITHGATSYSSFTINHPVYAHAPVVAHAPVYSAHAPLISSYYH